MKKLLIIMAALVFTAACGDGDNKKHPNNAGNSDQPVNSIDSVDDHHGANDSDDSTGSENNSH